MAKKTSPLKTVVKKQNKTPRLSAGLKRQIKIQRALYEIADAASAVTDMQSFYKRLHKIVGELMYAENFVIMLFDAITNTRSYPYYSDSAGDVAPPSSLIPAQSLLAELIRHPRTLHYNRRQNEEAIHRGEMFGTPSESFVGVPFKMGDQVIGGIIVQSYIKELTYSEEDVSVLEFVAQHIAVAITRARAIEETRQRNSELAIINSVQAALAAQLDIHGIFEVVGDKLQEIFSYQDVTIYFSIPKTDTVMVEYSFVKGEKGERRSAPMNSVYKHIIESNRTFVFNGDIPAFLAKFSDYSNPEPPKSLLAVPVRRNKDTDPIVYLTLQDWDGKKFFSDSDVRLMETLANSMSVALENARLFDETQRLLKETEDRNSELQIINSVQQGLASRLEVQSIYDLVGDRIRDIFKAQVVMISTYDKQTETIEHRYAIERGKRIYAPGHHPIRGFRIQVIETRQPVLVGTNVAELAAQLGQPTLPGTITPKTWLGVPLIVGDQVTGILSLQDVDRENAFGETAVRLLQTLADSMSVALENAHLWEQENLYRKALEREFEIGREIQAGFLPEILPQPKGWEIAASLKSAREVAGDLYDVFELPEDKIGLVIGDVCDKGLGAALFMTLFRSLIRAASNLEFFARVESDHGDSPAARLKNAISLTNNYIAEIHGNTGMFATIFFGILDTNTGMLTYINSGHLPPFLVNVQGVKEILKISGPAVGALADADYVVREVMIESGESFFAYTDGLIDTANPEGELFNEKDLLPLLADDQSLSSLLAEFQKRVADHAAGAKQYDDITLLAARRL